MKFIVTKKDIRFTADKASLMLRGNIITRDMLPRSSAEFVEVNNCGYAIASKILNFANIDVKYGDTWDRFVHIKSGDNVLLEKVYTAKEVPTEVIDNTINQVITSDDEDAMNVLAMQKGLDEIKAANEDKFNVVEETPVEEEVKEEILETTFVPDNASYDAKLADEVAIISGNEQCEGVVEELVEAETIADNKDLKNDEEPETQKEESAPFTEVGTSVIKQVPDIPNVVAVPIHNKKKKHR